MKLFRMDETMLVNPLQVETIVRSNNQHTGKFDVELQFTSGFVYSRGFDTDADRSTFVAAFRDAYDESV